MMTWTAPPIDRDATRTQTTERASLEQWLTFQRQTLLSKCSGLTGEQLTRAAVEPAKLTLLGLLRHMADVERWWFRVHFSGVELPARYYSDELPDGDFDLVDNADPEADYAAFVEECALADAAALGHELDETFVSPRGNSVDLRWVYMHMIQEYARHNGHADLLRERIDGATGF